MLALEPALSLAPQLTSDGPTHSCGIGNLPLRTSWGLLGLPSAWGLGQGR